MIRIPVHTPSRPYEVVLGSGLLARAGEHIGKLAGRGRVFVITVPPVRRRWGKVLMQSLAESGAQADILQMADGEPFKRLATLEKLAEGLVKLGADRGAILIALGGGVVYMRGLDVIQIPTTVLAQVDAAIGGKTGVNLQSGKNLLGTFHQPRAVLIDPNVLTTLPSREYRAGLYEALKCGIIGNVELFRLFEDHRREILDRDPVVIEKVIAESVRLKAEVVSADEREGGLRQVLNLGHTIGHALEAETRYTQLLHGEAVAWGMIAATQIALATGRLDPASAERITSATVSLGKLPRVKFQVASVLKRLQADKKTRQGVVHLVLPTQIGKVEIVNDVRTSVVRSAIEEIESLQ
ncbi:MAG: 3-dehydroquinate synthase [Acidobacteria bacterium]|nr:MAG: 3-dehydroquinate synthase [Acidobacteriota bacterium]